MYTGIIDHIGRISSCIIKNDMRHLRIETTFENFTRGESIAVDGMCVTVTNFDTGYFECDLSPNTLSVTIADTYAENTYVNLERSLAFGDRVGGHMVTGHVEGIATVASIEYESDCCKMIIGAMPRDLRRFIHKKGSVCVQGASLTVNALTADGFELMLIPQTLALTRLKDLKAGDPVNIECDMLAKMIARQLEFINEEGEPCPA
jgi:riboflavin synthase